MVPEVIVFDLDDTLLRDDRTISPFTLKTLREAAEMGFTILPASGRTQTSMLPFVNQIQCAAGYISCNGGELWTADHRLVFRETLDAAFIRELLIFAETHDCHAQTYYDGRFYYSRQDRWADEYASATMLEGVYVPDLVAFCDRPSTKVLMIDSDEKIAELYGTVRALYSGRAQVTCSKSNFLEINPLGASKGNALRRAAQAFGFDMAKTAAFGDSLNELSMLEAAAFGYAMANARDDIRSRVSLVCPSNQDDGVARTVLSFMDSKQTIRKESTL